MLVQGTLWLAVRRVRLHRVPGESLVSGAGALLQGGGNTYERFQEMSSCFRKGSSDSGQSVGISSARPKEEAQNTGT